MTRLAAFAVFVLATIPALPLRAGEPVLSEDFMVSTANPHASRAARDIRPHQRQQCASVLELCSNCWPQASVPVANLSSESIHSIEHRQSEPQQQHPAGEAPHRTLDLSWAGPAAAKHGVHFAGNLCVRSRRCSELVVVEQVP